MALAVGEFLNRLEASRVLDPDKLGEVRAAAPDPDADAEPFVRELRRTGWLTAHQANMLWSNRGSQLVLGNYVVEDELGRGGMGVVYKARHRVMRRHVAIKVLPQKLCKDESAIARFDREVVAAAQLMHENIVSAHDANEFDGQHVLVMEFVDGRDLSSVVKDRGPLSLEQALDCVVQTARGLAYAHETGVVHRDIKPANLLLDSSGTVKILDMGLARFGDAANVNAQAELTGTGTIMGTADYMSPEQAASTRTADERSDVYSLGMTLYYLLTGEPAYKGDSLMARLMAHVKQPIPSLLDVRPNVPLAVQDVFERMVAKQPEDRLQSMHEVIAALEACSSDGSATIITASARDAIGEAESGVLADVEDRTGLTGSNRTHREVRPNVPTGDEHVPTEIHAASSGTIRTRSFEKTPSDSQSSPSGGGARSNRNVLLLGAGVAVALIAFAVAIFNPTKKGTLQVELAEPGIELRVPGTSIVVETVGTTNVALTPGEHVLSIRHGNVAVETSSFEVVAGKTYVVRAEIVDDTLRASVAGNVLGSRSMASLASNSPTTTGVPTRTNGTLSGSDYALEFVEANRRVETPILDDGGPLTIEGWCWSRNRRLGYLFSNMTPEGGFSLEVAGGARAWRLSFAQGENRWRHGPNAFAPIDEWVHVAAVRSDEHWTTFVDGEPTARQRIEQLSPLDSTMPFAIGGKHDGMFPFTGRIRSARITRAVLYDRSFEPSWEFDALPQTVGLYEFDEGTGEVVGDASGNGNEARVFGAEWVAVERTSSPSLPEIVLEFDGRNDAVVVDDLRFPDGEPLTVEAYVRPEATGPPQWIVCNAEQCGFGIGMNAGRWQFVAYGPDAPKLEVNADAPAEVGRRVHVAGVYDGLSLRLFVDGVKQSEVTRVGPLRQGDFPLVIGGNPTATGTIVQHLRGGVDAVRISRTHRYDDDFVPPHTLTSDASTVALYECDDFGSDVLKDASGNGHDGRIDGARWSRPTRSSPQPAARYALAFDGNDCVALDSLRYGLGPHTVECWYRAPLEGQWQSVLVQLTGEQSRVKIVAMQHGTRLQHVRIREDGIATGNNNCVIEAGHRFVHVAGVWDGEKGSLFLDGRLVGDRWTPGPQLGVHPENPSAIGGVPRLYNKDDIAGPPLIGELTELRVSSVARYTHDFEPARRHVNDEDTVALYHFDEAAGNVLRDASGNGYDGTIHGARWVRTSEPASVLPHWVAGSSENSVAPTPVAPEPTTKATTVATDARIWRVGDTETPFTELQAAFVGANPGDTIEIGTDDPIVLTEPLVWSKGAPLTIRPAGDARPLLVVHDDVPEKQSRITFRGRSTPTDVVRLEGVTIVDFRPAASTLNAGCSLSLTDCHWIGGTQQFVGAFGKDHELRLENCYLHRSGKASSSPTIIVRHDMELRNCLFAGGGYLNVGSHPDKEIVVTMEDSSCVGTRNFVTVCEGRTRLESRRNLFVGMNSVISFFPLKGGADPESLKTAAAWLPEYRGQSNLYFQCKRLAPQVAKSAADDLAAWQSFTGNGEVDSAVADPGFARPDLVVTTGQKVLHPGAFSLDRASAVRRVGVGCDVSKLPPLPPGVNDVLPAELRLRN